MTQQAEPFIYRICNILDIECPQIQFVPYIAITFYPPGSITKSAVALGGYSDSIPKDDYVSGNTPDDIITNENSEVWIAEFLHTTMQQKNLPELIFSIAHELYHVHQYKEKGAAKSNSEHNSYGIESIDDTDEIYADAFAFVFLSHSDFAKEEWFPAYSAMFSLDGGKRFARALAIEKKYWST